MKHCYNHITRLHLWQGWSVLITMLLLSSCNLFIEDEIEEELKGVPVHTGYGYDSEVQEDGEFYTLKYQLKSNVNKLSAEAQSYITESHFHSTGILGCIDFALDTPEELRPKKGEILLCGPGKLGPDGLIHEVKGTVEMDGVYRIVTCAIPFEDIFRSIDMDIDVAKAMNLQGLSDYEDTTENVTRSDIEIIAGEDEFHKKVRVPSEEITLFEDESTIGKKSWKIFKDLKISGKVTLTPNFEKDDDNRLDIKLKPHVRVLKSDDIKIPFGLSVDANIDYFANWTLSGSATLSGTIWEKDDVLPSGCAFIIPVGEVPVRIKVCCGMALSFEASYQNSADINFRVPLKTTVSRDIFDIATPTLSVLISDAKKWKLDKDKAFISISQGIGASAELGVAITPGVGIGNEKTSIRAIIAGKLTATVNSLKKNYGTFNYGWDFRNNEGITLEFDWGIGATLTAYKNISSIVSDVINAMADAQKTIGQIYAFLVLGEGDVDTYNGYIEAVNDLNAWIKGLDPEKGVSDNDKEMNTWSIPPQYCSENEKTKDLVPQPIEFYWMPKLDDANNPFNAVKQLASPGFRKEDVVHLEFGIEDTGIMPYFSSYAPCVMITTMNYKFKKLVIDWNNFVEWGMNKTKLKEWKAVFDIPLKDLPQNSELYAIPGFVNSGATIDEELAYEGFSSAYNSFYFNKPLKFSTKKASDTKLKWIKCTSEPIKLAREQKDGCKYYRTFEVSWEIIDNTEDKYTGIEYSFTPTEDNYIKLPASIKEKTYTATFHRYTMYEDDLKIEVIPFSIHDDGSEKGEYARGSVRFMGNIESNTTLVFKDDGSYDVRRQ